MTGTSKNIVIQAEPIVININPIGFHRYAQEFLRAEEAFQTTDNFSPVPYYLLCRSIELSLKAYLLLKGCKIEYLKSKIGHNLKRLLNKAKELNIEEIITISTEESDNILKANVYYEKKGFEYFFVIDAVTGYKELPDIELLRSVSTQFSREIVSTMFKCINTKTL